MTTAPRSFVLALALSCAVAGFAVAQEVAASSGAAAATLPSIHIDNFGRVNSHYYRGAQPQTRDYSDLAALGVKTIIDLTSDDRDPTEQASAERAGIKWFNIPLNTRVEPTSTELAAFFAIVNDPGRQPVFVHCVGGRHRTGVMTAAYRMSNEGWTASQAFQEMKRYNFGADFLHPELKRFVYSFNQQQ